MVDELVFLIAFCMIEFAVTKWQEWRSVPRHEFDLLVDQVIELRKENHTGDLRERLARLEALGSLSSVEEMMTLRERIAALESLYEQDDEEDEEGDDSSSSESSKEATT